MITETEFLLGFKTKLANSKGIEYNHRPKSNVFSFVSRDPLPFPHVSFTAIFQLRGQSSSFFPTHASFPAMIDHAFTTPPPA